MDISSIDIDRLRKDLIDYYGTGVYNLNVSVIDLIKVERCPSYMLVDIALQNGFNLNNYKINSFSRVR